MLTTNHLYLAIAAILVVSALAIWLAPKVEPGAAPVGGH